MMMTTGSAKTTNPPAAAAARAPLANGKVVRVENGLVIFTPAGTNYELRLVSPGYAGPLNKPVRGTIRVTARKVWTVPSGGNFIAPIFGPPRTIQGQVRAVTKSSLIVHAGVPVHVDMPDNDILCDLANGAISVGVMVNVTGLPGATFELAVV